MSDTGPMVLQVIIPTFNNRTELQQCLRALAFQTNASFSALVCIDGSTDGTDELFTHGDFAFPLSVLRHADGRNHGRAAARNLALPHLRTPFVLLLDSDMRLEPDAVSHHVRLLEERDCVSIGDVRYDNAGRNLWARYIGTRGKNKFAPAAEVRPLDFVTANTALRTEHLIKLAGFDETLAGYGGEDTELALRLASKGLPFVYNADARAVSTEEKTIEDGLAELHQFARTNLPAIRRRHPRGPAPFMVDRLESRRVRDRALRLALNPLADRLVRSLLPRVPFRVQRLLLHYLVIRTVFRGYGEATR